MPVRKSQSIGNHIVSQQNGQNTGNKALVTLHRQRRPVPGVTGPSPTGVATESSTTE